MQIRYDSDRGLDYVDDGSGGRRYLAAFPTQDYAGVGLPRFAAASVIPRSDWFEIDLEASLPSPTPVWDQGQHGSCVGHGSAMAFLYAWLLSGGTFQEFSPTFLYGLINGGQDQGAIVGDALKALTDTGVALMSEVPESMIYRQQFPQSAFATAQRFKIDPAESAQCGSYDELMSAIMTGAGAVSHGIEIGQDYNPDGRGVIPPLRGGGGGHCQCGMGTKNFGGRQSSTYTPAGSFTKILGGEWYCKTKNSWGKRFGLNGYIYIPESYFEGSGDHWYVRAGLPDPTDPLNPPAPKD